MAKVPIDDGQLLRDLLENAQNFSAYGLVSKSDLMRIKVLCEVPPTYTPERVFEIRTKHVKASQAVFASLLNVSLSTVQKWESSAAEKRPGGAAAKLLQLIEAKGIDALIP